MSPKFKQLMQRCKNDPVFFITNFYTIKDSQTGEALKLKLWDFQEEYVRSFKSKQNPDGYRFHLVLKSRQLGLSTTTLALVLHKALFHKNAKIVIACKKQADASKMLTDEIYFALDNLPSFMKPEVITRNSTRIHFKASNSWIQAVAATPSAIRQFQASHIIFDEFAFYNEIRADLDQEMYRAALPSFQRNGFCTIISTPNGLGNMYADYVEQALKNELPPEWKFYQFSWKLRTERLYDKDGNFDDGESFKQSVLALPNGKRIWAAEYDCQLLGSGNGVFTADAFSITRKTEEMPRRGVRYVIGADIGSGGGGDYSVAQVLTEYGEQVFTYRSNTISPKDFGDILVALAKRYNNALIAPERNNMGVATIDQIKNKNYRNLYIAPDGKEGFLTTAQTKPQIIFDLDKMLIEGLITLSDAETLNELQMYQHLDTKTASSKLGAPPGKHDDCVMSLAIASHLINHNILSYQRKTYDRIL